MSKKEKKRDKREYQKIQQEWIEMQDLHDLKNEDMSKKFAKQQGKQYIPLQREQQSPIKQKKQQPYINPYTDKRQNKVTIEEDYIPEFKKLQIRTKKKPSLPMMEVTCDFCTVVQNVPGNTQVFICGSCENMNECYPLYGILICGFCQKKVGFGFGTSKFIKCPNCSAINGVPIEPIKKYEGTFNNGLERQRPQNIQGQRQIRGGRQLENDHHYNQFQAEPVNFFGFQENEEIPKQPKQ